MSKTEGGDRTESVGRKLRKSFMGYICSFFGLWVIRAKARRGGAFMMGERVGGVVEVPPPPFEGAVTGGCVVCPPRLVFGPDPPPTPAWGWTMRSVEWSGLYASSFSVGEWGWLNLDKHHHTLKFPPGVKQFRGEPLLSPSPPPPPAPPARLCPPKARGKGPLTCGPVRRPIQGGGAAWTPPPLPPAVPRAVHISVQR